MSSLFSIIVHTKGVDDGNLEPFLKINHQYPEGIFYDRFNVETPVKGWSLEKAANFTLKTRCNHLFEMEIYYTAHIAYSDNRYSDQKCPICFEECSKSIFKCGHPYHCECYHSCIRECPFCRCNEPDLIQLNVHADTIVNDPEDESDPDSNDIVKFLRELWKDFS